MATSASVTTDGIVTQFTVPCPYLDRSHIKVEVNGVVQATTAYTFLTDSTIEITPALPAGRVVRIYRSTPTVPLVEYQAGAVLTKGDLEVDSKQALYLIEELEDIRGGNAETVNIVDSLNLFTSSNVEGALRELAQRESSGDGTLRTDLAAATSGKGTDLISVRDPVAPAFLKTTSDIINGERVSILRAISKTGGKHAAIRAGTFADNLAAEINPLLADMATAGYGDLYVPEGVYTVKGLNFGSGLKITGQGKRTVLKAVAGIANNEKIASAVGTLNDLHISNVLFDGNNCGAGATQARFTELLAFNGIQNLKLEDVVIRNTQYIGAAFAQCGHVNLTRVTAQECGWDHTVAVSTNGGPALWFGPVGSNLCENVELIGCILKDNRWHGATMTAKNVSVIGGFMLRNREAHLFSSSTSTYTSSSIKIVGVTANNVKKADISSSGFELGAHRIIFTNNSVEDCEHNGLAMTDVQEALVTDNYFADWGKDTTTQANAVSIITASASPNHPKNVTITRNRCKGISATSWGSFGVGGGGAAVENVTFEDNDCRGYTPRSTTGHIAWNGKRGAGSYTADNPGVGDEAMHSAVHLATTTHTISTGTDSLVFFDTEIADFDGLWVPGNGERFTIPQGWSKVEIEAQVTFEPNAAGIRQVRLLKNGSPGGAPGMPNVIIPAAPASFSTPVLIKSGVLSVVPGDYFTIRCRQESGVSLNLTSGAAQTWFVIRRIA